MGFGRILADTFPLVTNKSVANLLGEAPSVETFSSETQCHTFEEEHCEANVYLLLMLTPIRIELCYMFLLIFCTELLFIDFRSGKFTDE